MIERHYILIDQLFFVVINVTNKSVKISMIKSMNAHTFGHRTHLKFVSILCLGCYAFQYCNAYIPSRITFSQRNEFNRYGIVLSSNTEHHSSFELSRREVILSTFVASSVLVSPRASYAKEDIPIPTLVDLKLGESSWIDIHDAQISQEIILSSSKLIPPNFATYVTRFLINYDLGISKWWEELKMTYSLLPAAEERSKLGQNFGALAKSLQISIGNYILNEEELNNNVSVQQRFEDLLRIFINTYAMKENGEIDESVARDIGILFAILPASYQPKLETISRKNVGSSQNMDRKTLSIAYTEELTELLPSSFSYRLDKDKNAYFIEPPVPLYEIGIDDEFGQTAISTLFGPLSSKPLRRQKPDLSFATYALFGLSGALGCSITHSVVIPFDVVKTRLQTDPGQYSNIIDGTLTIAKEEGLDGFLLGSQATIAGYFWYGLSVYPTYAFFKFWLEHFAFSPAFAAANADGIAFGAGVIAAIIASIGLTPIEACRIRSVSEPELFRPLGLIGTAQYLAREDSILGWRTLYAGLSSLMIRQVIFGGIKFLAFERACEAFFVAWPALRDTTASSLFVTVTAGALAGALSSIASQPADSILTYIAKNKRENEDLGVFEGCKLMIENEGPSSLFRGLGSRCIWASAIISGQFLLYDIFRNALGISTEDLSQVFEVLIANK